MAMELVFKTKKLQKTCNSNKLLQKEFGQDMSSTPIRNEYHPDFVSPPGDSLSEILESMGMSQAELATRMGRPTKTINEIIRGKAAITPETALQLEKVLQLPAQFWNNREKQYRESLAQQREQRRLGWFN